MVFELGIVVRVEVEKNDLFVVTSEHRGLVSRCIVEDSGLRDLERTTHLTVVMVRLVIVGCVSFIFLSVQLLFEFTLSSA